MKVMMGAMTMTMTTGEYAATNNQILLPAKILTEPGVKIYSKLTGSEHNKVGEVVPN